jgi:uncharacterized GH25 family protein
MRRLVFLVVLVVPQLVFPHDTWLIPSNFRMRPGRAVRIRLATGEAFPASEVAVTPDRVLRFTARDARGVRKISEYHVEGEFLIAELKPQWQGTVMLAVETGPRTLEMPEKDFNDYLRDEQLNEVLQSRARQNKTRSPGRERYRKIAKAALCVGEVEDTTHVLAEGLLLELIPEENPCGLHVGDSLGVRVFYEGQPLAKARVVAGYSGVTGHHYPIQVRADADGRAAIVVDRPGAWFVRVLHLAPAGEDPEADWHTTFSTLTFEVRP